MFGLVLEQQLELAELLVKTADQNAAGSHKALQSISHTVALYYTIFIGQEQMIPLMLPARDYMSSTVECSRSQIHREIV